MTVSTATPEHGELTRTESKLDQNEEDIELLKAAIGEVERYRSMDRLIPSVHNVVTVSALEVCIKGQKDEENTTYISFV